MGPSSDRGWGGVIAFWALVVGGVAVPLFLAGSGFGFIARALAVGAAAAAASALVLGAAVLIGGVIVFSVMALLGPKGDT